jgi:hypothetical protein
MALLAENIKTTKTQKVTYVIYSVTYYAKTNDKFIDEKSLKYCGHKL